MNTSKHQSWANLSPWALIIFIMLTTVAISDSSGVRPGPSPEPDIDFPNPGVFSPYRNPACADNMERSEVETINDENNGTPWHYYTCTFNNNGWCSLNTGHCPEQICHPFTDWIGPWNNIAGRDQPDIVWHYTCVSIGSPFPFTN